MTAKNQNIGGRPQVYQAGMKSHEVLREVVVVSGQIKAVVCEVDCSQALVYRWAQPKKGEGGTGVINPLDVLDPILCHPQGRQVVQQVCERAGGCFIANPKPCLPATLSPLAANGRNLREFADLQRIIVQAAEDDSVSREEAAGIRSRWDNFKRLIEGFVRACEDGDFSSIEKKLQGEPRPILDAPGPCSSPVRNRTARVKETDVARAAERIIAIFGCTQDRRVIQWICERAGGFFIGSTRENWPHLNSVAAACGKINHNFGDMLSIIGGAVMDNAISSGEARAIRTRWDELRFVTESFVHCCEKGNFSQLRERLGRNA